MSSVALIVTQAPFVYPVGMMLGATIRAFRKQAKLSQCALGKLVGTSAAAVSNWERNVDSPSMEHLPKIAEAIGASIDQLYRRDPEINPATPKGERPIDIELFKSFLPAAFELQGLTPDMAQTLVEALLREARTPLNSSRGVPSEAEIRIRVETLLRQLGRK